MKTATRVMIIEDDLAIAELHHKYLSQLSGLEVVGIATTRMEAEMQLEILNPDLLLMDVYLPDGTGLEILNTLRAKNQTCDVILITAARDVDTLQTAMRGGVVDYLLKPIMFPRLEVALKKYLAQRERFDIAGSLDQSQVDKMFQSNNIADTGAKRLPKGIDSVTLDKIRDLFPGEEMLTADEAGEKIGASRTTARRYLEYLISSGELEADLNYGTVGRPERCYKKVTR
ncbi:response regulator [Vibrio natriegens]|uniref:Transcriptional regulatory protein n=1 Tax=Vibrio natriegens NBRC 15636 = ATCC 14048 = DSM 759 TaxID=1219067 RepID=A0AAN0Y312_VIBNA|nr:response regulator [Vibrio natriegens]ALR15417.1 chemotaxis protein CheY [Vibrio natriegens NBRC 15636 = ATCC 14048 = DSM 759]ANQ12723.1 two-component system response regulator [Vibrio natriegens NBRC 15636 = ATCC 14048 = DSM 759]EPM38330.1 chemotaxis protein CheY [Vibrio natriegens NBRC 15636 = ATCC 14048 = DSM 759]MDX6027123.1 response regulator [Vibrio natriegens NBRC 15636 = ATCC 14048 = DSM 759]UUI10448.1 response regulator [Vibrio natriegens]